MYSKWGRGEDLGEPFSFECQKRGFDAIPHLELLQNVGHVMLDRLFGQMQLVSNLLIALAGRHKLQNFTLALAQLV